MFTIEPRAIIITYLGTVEIDTWYRYMKPWGGDPKDVGLSLEINQVCRFVRYFSFKPLESLASNKVYSLVVV